MSNSSTRKSHTNLGKEGKSNSRFLGFLQAVDQGDIEDTSGENESEEEELNESKKQHVVLGTYKCLSSYNLCP